MKSLTLFAAATVLLCHTAADAQVSANKFAAGLLVGGSKMRGDIANTNTGITGGIVLKYLPLRRFAISTSATYGNMTSGLNAIKTTIFNASLLGTFFVLPESKFRPFLSLGVSRFHYGTTDGDGKKMRRPDGEPILGWETALQFGVGFEFFTGEQWAINSVGSYNLTGVDELDGITMGRSDGFFNGLIGLVHYFRSGKRPQRDDRPSQSWERIKQSLRETPGANEHANREQSESGIFARGIYFQPNSSRLLDKSRAQLNKIYEYLGQHPGEEIELRARGKQNSLVRQRAQVVKAYLIGLGIQPERVIITTD